MADLLQLSTDIIDRQDVDPGFTPGPVNRITHELSELNSSIAMVEAFSHSILFKTDDGMVVFDTSGDRGGSRVVEAIRGWAGERFNTLVYTHGHIDHVGGCGAFLADAESNGHPRPAIAGHENVAKRFDRYNFTDGYNQVINERQFRSFSRRGYDIGGVGPFLPEATAAPDITYSDHLDISVGGLDIQMHHAKGETDDHTWAWLPEHKAICAGDFFIWNFPNAGNPQKVQRYPVEWAAAMRDMANQGAELFLPAHGLPIEGAARIRAVLTDVAEALELLVAETIKLMNDGAKLNDIIHAVHVPQAVLDKPYLRPMYDEPEFVVRNIWRMYGGWYDGNPANLKPA
ncbi:MAG: MBL fold metallo-hydrolase, partial [Gammaproteobacteria bacterium]|nr:MBL fold metallo-hydrolase [Gammaproteobacteria bacterium]